jgi:hypothetical protein
MARGNSNNGDTTEAPAEGAATEATEAKSGDSRFKMLDVPEGHASGLSGQQKRVDVIRAMAKTGQYTRGQIKTAINELGDPIAYQIVFQATRGIDNIPKAERKAKAEAPAESAAEATPVEA